MNNALTDITLIIDRSGSMDACRRDAEGGVNAFIRSQGEQPGDALLTLVQFDTEYEFVHQGVPIKGVPAYTLMPRGGTALYDAVGRAIVETGQRLAAMPEADRPGLVLMAIVTDGEENSSREYTGERVKAMIQHQTDVYQWQFTYLGANQDAMLAAGRIGIAPGAVMDYDVSHSGAAFDEMSSNLAFARKRIADGGSAMPAMMHYSPSQRDRAMGRNTTDSEDDSDGKAAPAAADQQPSAPGGGR